MVNCGSCHNAYPLGPDYANGYKGKANSHPKHAAFWGFTCDWCHNQTTTTGSTITNVRNHVNKNYNVVANSTKAFIGKTNTFTATATTNPPTVKTTCSSVNCHGGNASKVFTWGGTNKCGDCHLTTGADLVNYGFSKTPTSIANINVTEWKYSGHGKSTGNYDKTGAIFAGFSAAAANSGTNPAGDQCLYCHDYSVQHGVATNPLRLRNFAHPTYGKNGVCLACHATGAAGVTPAAGYANKNATRKINKYHYGANHSNNLNSGRFCWDCHDGHGDKANATTGPIAMIHLKPAMTVYTSTGVPNTIVATNVNFLKYSAAYFGATASPYNGICNVCHTYKSTGGDKMTHYTATSSDSHRSTSLCTTCHKHSADTTYDGKAYEGNASACDGCHAGSNSSVGRLSVSATAGHVTHYNLATVFNHYTGSNKHTASAYGFACKNCHNTTTTANHQNGGTANMLTTIGYSGSGTTANDGSGYPYYTNAACATNVCHNNGRLGAPATSSVAWSTSKSASNCGVCHVNMATSAAASGSHVKHTQASGTVYACSVCHGAGYSSNGVVYTSHVDNQVNIAFTGTGTGTTYSKAAPIALNGVFGTCSNGNCHGTGPVTWGANLGTVQCEKCHGSAGTASTGTFKLTNGTTTSISSTLHVSHLNSTHNWSSDIACTQCHAAVASVGTTGHIDSTLPAEITWGPLAAANGTPTNYTQVGQTCVTWCHGGVSTNGIPQNKPTPRTVPAWTTAFPTTSTFGDALGSASTNTGSGRCAQCHGFPPATSDHNGATLTGAKSCNSCHNHVSTVSDGANAVTFSDPTKHINGTIDGGDCVSCHGSIVTIGNGPLAGSGQTRRAVSLEFANTWSHKRTAGGTVTKWDCIVCHMEGDMGSGSTTSLHKDGLLQLRDPDTGTTIKQVSFSGTPGSYASTTTDAAPARFSRNLSVQPESDSNFAVTAAIMINQCLHCHDSNGANNASARVPTVGTALRPFGTAPTHTPGQNVLNVSQHFDTSNSSYHPVKGKQNNSYAANTRMTSPWNVTKTTGNTTSWGYLMTCWDCHAPNGTASSVTLTSTVTAHGGATTLRGAPTVTGTPSTTNTVTLCTICHAGYQPGGTINTHGTGSAESGNTNSGMTAYMNYGCNMCHSSGYSTVVARPVRSQDVHGVNVLPTGGVAKTGRWATNATPIAFIRNTQVLGDHSPARIGASTYSPNCNMVSGSPINCNQGVKNYSVGGTF